MSVSVFEAALKGNYKPFEDILLNRERRALPVRQLIEQRLEMYKNRTGEITKVKATATLPTSLDGEEAVLTCVRLKGERGSIFFGLYWRNRLNIGVGPLRSTPDLSVPFMRISDSEFAGYRLDLARNMSLRFKEEDGTVTGLIIQAPGKEITAQKEN